MQQFYIKCVYKLYLKQKTINIMLQKYKIYWLTSIMMVILSLGNHLIAQDDESLTKGKDFWLTFLPNYHNYAGTNLSQFDSLYVLIAADEVTSGTITYRDYLGMTYTRNFIISNPDNVYEFRVSWENYELKGFNDSQDNLLFNSQNENVAPQSFRIQTDKGVNVYAHSQAVTTSEAATIYPTEALDDSYIILSYNSDGSSDFFDVTSQSTPSQYAVVAAYDSTIVTFNNSVPTWNNRSNQVRLDEGDVYLVQSDINQNNLNYDLTGSEVTANKPIAVFAGHQRANVPVGFGISRDMLFEQIPSKRSLGREYIVVPFPQHSSITNTGVDDIFRILALEDGTTLEIDGVFVDVLDAGEFYENNISEPVYIKASKKVITAAYKKTSQITSSDAISDPFFMILPPVEKYSNKYKFLNIQASEEASQSFDVYTHQYVTIVTENRNLSDIKLDGNKLDPSLFSPVDGTNYSYAVIKVNDGNHTAEAKYKFTVWVYGYGFANSYAYFAGMNYKGDQVMPEFQSEDDCFEVTGTVSDSTYLDSGIQSIVTIDSLSSNTTTEFEQINSPARVVGFNSRLENIYQDGNVSLIAFDSSGIFNSINYDIKGFTVGLKSFPVPDDPNAKDIVKDTIAADIIVCEKFILYNYGKFEQTITQNNLTNIQDFTTDLPDSVTIPPGDEYEFEICFNGGDLGIYKTELIIQDDCADRNILEFSAYIVGDSARPEITAKADDCYDVIDVIITDSLAWDSGIEAINVLKSDNCEVRIRNESRNRFDLAIYVIDKLQDAEYIIEAVDSSGNTNRIEGIIQGFTLGFTSAYNEDSSNVDIDFGNQTVGNSVCDTFNIYNYGKYPFVIEKPYFYEHIYFSTPELQFPITLNPGEDINIAVCFRSKKVKETNYIDTLYFEHNCYEYKIPLTAISDTLFAETEGRCLVPLEIRVAEVPDDYFVMQNYPNPFSSITNITFGMPEDGNVITNIYNSYGQLVENLINTKLNKGTYTFEYNKNTLPQGIYFYEVRINSFRKVKKMIIN